MVTLPVTSICSDIRLRGDAAYAKNTKPNILVIWGDDIGITNLSCYSDGLMGYRKKAASFTIDQAMEKMESVASGAGH